MKQKLTLRRVLGWLLAAGALVGLVFSLGGPAYRGLLLGQSSSPPGDEKPSGVFSPAHDSIGIAIRHFIGLRDEPVQPIDYSHSLHVAEVGLRCDFCHNGVSVGPRAGTPGIETCMLCHQGVGRDLPGVQSLLEYYDAGLEPPWERVYGWDEEAHVRFNHRPHYQAEVACETCHGEVSAMGVAVRAVEHTMSFCVDCHEQAGASNDCLACHY